MARRCGHVAGPRALIGDEADEAGDEVAEGDAGEDSEDAERVVVEVREGGEEHLDGEDEDCGAADDVEGEGFAAVAPLARRESREKMMEAPTRKRKLGKTRSVRVKPFQGAWSSWV